MKQYFECLIKARLQTSKRTYKSKRIWKFIKSYGLSTKSAFKKLTPNTK